MSSSEAAYRPKGRPQSSTITRSFGASLDQMFKLDEVHALELSVKQKKHQVQDQERSLEDLDAKLREATERLKKLEAKHKRQSQMYPSAASPRSNTRHILITSEGSSSEDSSGDPYSRINPENGLDSARRRQ